MIKDGIYFWQHVCVTKATEYYFNFTGCSPEKRSKLICGSAILTFIASFFNWCKSNGTCTVNCCSTPAKLSLAAASVSPKVIFVVGVVITATAAATGTIVYVHHQQGEAKKFSFHVPKYSIRNLSSEPNLPLWL